MQKLKENDIKEYQILQMLNYLIDKSFYDYSIKKENDKYTIFNLICPNEEECLKRDHIWITADFTNKNASYEASMEHPHSGNYFNKITGQMNWEDFLTLAHEKLSIRCKDKLSEALVKEQLETKQKIFNDEINNRFNRLF